MGDNVGGWGEVEKISFWVLVEESGLGPSVYLDVVDDLVGSDVLTRVVSNLRAEPSALYPLCEGGH